MAGFSCPFIPSQGFKLQSFLDASHQKGAFWNPAFPLFLIPQVLKLIP